MDQRVVYNLDLPEAGPEQINNIRQQHLVRNRQRAVEQREQRWEQRAAAVVQGQVGGGGRPGAIGPQDQGHAIAGAGNNHVVPWRQGDPPAAGIIKTISKFFSSKSTKKRLVLVSISIKEE